MDLREIEAVCAVNAYRNYSEAAFHSFSSPSVVSKQVARVEEELGIRIFERATKTAPVRLTPEGENLIPHFKQIANQYYRMLSKTAAMKSNLGETLTVGYQPSPASSFEKDTLIEFSLENPACSLRYITGGTAELIQQLVNGTLSAAFLSLMVGTDELNSPYVSLADPDFSVTELFTHNRLYLGVPLDHPLAQQDMIRREQYPLLYQETFLLPMEQRDDSWVFQRNYIRRIIHNPMDMKIRYVDQSATEIVLKLVERGFGILPKPCASVRQVGGVRFVPVEDTGTPIISYFIYRKSNISPALLHLKNTVLSCSETLRKDADLC